MFDRIRSFFRRKKNEEQPKRKLPEYSPETPLRNILRAKRSSHWVWANCRKETRGRAVRKQRITFLDKESKIIREKVIWHER